MTQHTTHNQTQLSFTSTNTTSYCHHTEHTVTNTFSSLEQIVGDDVLALFNHAHANNYAIPASMMR